MGGWNVSRGDHSDRVAAPRSTELVRRVLRIALLAHALVFVHRDVIAQTSPALDWDDATAQVNGYAVSIDGVRVDYGLSPLGSNLTCGCSIALPFSGGSHTLQVSAYNSLGESWSSVLIVAPVANAGGPYNGTVSVPVSVNGSGSTDPTGTITTYAWDWGDGSSATSSSSATAAHAYSGSGTFTVTLQVTDNGGATARAATTSTISASTNIPPTANDDSATVRRFGQSVTIPVLQNDSDANGDPLTILGVGAPSHGSATIKGATVVYTSSGHYTGPVAFTYTIGDGHGGTATATVHVTVTR